MTAYRGVQAGEFDAVWRDVKPGDVVRKPDFTSTSIRPEAGDSFRHADAPMLRVLLPKGLRGVAYVDPFPIPERGI